MKINDHAIRCWRHVSSFVLIALVAVDVSLTQVAGIAQGDPPVFPGLIQRPADFGSEGIAVGKGNTFYVASFAPPSLGQIIVGDLRAGAPGKPQRVASVVVFASNCRMSR
jgi:hypothetical protein